jgi:hypothetical protein
MPRLSKRVAFWLLDRVCPADVDSKPYLVFKYWKMERVLWYKNSLLIFELEAHPDEDGHRDFVWRMSTVFHPINLFLGKP